MSQRGSTVALFYTSIKKQALKCAFPLYSAALPPRDDSLYFFCSAFRFCFTYDLPAGKKTEHLDGKVLLP